LFSEKKIEDTLEKIWSDNDLREISSSFDKINLAFEIIRYESDLSIGLNSYSTKMQRTKMHAASIRSILKYWEYKKIIFIIQGNRKDKKHPVFSPRVKEKLVLFKHLLEGLG
jgi:hypothetical protein